MIEELNARYKAIQCNAIGKREKYFHEQIYELNRIQLFAYIVMVKAKNQP
jgi:hypothetical protein